METILKIITVGCGSFIGGALRYLISLALQNKTNGFPWGTLIVNLLGCFLIGCLTGLLSKASQSQYLSLFLTVGLCGGFTTFSTFSKECLNMLQCGNILHCVLYSSISLLVGVLFVFIGLKITAFIK